MDASEIMTSPVETVGLDATLEDAARRMVEKGIGCLPVVDEAGAVHGMVTEEEFMARSESVPWAFFKAPRVFDQWLGEGGIEEAYEKARSIPVKEVMREPVLGAPDTEMDEVVTRMLEGKSNHLIVYEKDEVVGIISRHDLLRVMSKR